MELGVVKLVWTQKELLSTKRLISTTLEAAFLTSVPFPCFNPNSQHGE